LSCTWVLIPVRPIPTALPTFPFSASSAACYAVGVRFLILAPKAPPIRLPLMLPRLPTIPCVSFFSAALIMPPAELEKPEIIYPPSPGIRLVAPARLPKAEPASPFSRLLTASPRNLPASSIFQAMLLSGLKPPAPEAAAAIIAPVSPVAEAAVTPLTSFPVLPIWRPASPPTIPPRMPAMPPIRAPACSASISSPFFLGLLTFSTS